MKVELAVPGSPSLNVLMVSEDVKQTDFGDRSELRSHVKVEGGRLGGRDPFSTSDP